VLALFDIDVTKRSEQRLRMAKEYSDALLDLVDQPIAVLDAGLRVLVASDRFARVLGKTTDAIVGRHVSDLSGAWKLAALHERIHAASGSRSGFERIPIEINTDDGPRVWLSGRWLPWHESPETQVLLLSISPSDAAAASRDV
jgi:PAS domain S-box-containing protein